MIEVPERYMYQKCPDCKTIRRVYLGVEILNKLKKEVLLEIQGKVDNRHKRLLDEGREDRALEMAAFSIDLELMIRGLESQPHNQEQGTFSRSAPKRSRKTDGDKTD